MTKNKQGQNVKNWPSKYRKTHIVFALHGYGIDQTVLFACVSTFPYPEAQGSLLYNTYRTTDAFLLLLLVLLGVAPAPP